MVRRFLNIGMRKQGLDSSRFWGEKEVADRRGVGERKTILWIVAKWRDNRRVRDPGAGDILR